MSADTPSEVPFDLEKFKELVSLMEKHELSEVDLKSGDSRWRVRRGPAEVHVMPGGGYAMPAPQYAPAPAAAVAAPQHAAPTVAAAPSEEPGSLIRSPTVGTFYAAASPGDDPFVSVGSKVSKDTVVCIIEAMKVMNHITADVGGTVTEVLVKNGDAVEFNQPLFKVKLG